MAGIVALGTPLPRLAVVCWRRDECLHGGSSEKACVIGYFVNHRGDPQRVESIVRVVGDGPNGTGARLIRERALRVCQCVDGVEIARWHGRAVPFLESDEEVGAR